MMLSSAASSFAHSHSCTNAIVAHPLLTTTTTTFPSSLGKRPQLSPRPTTSCCSRRPATAAFPCFRHLLHRRHLRTVCRATEETESQDDDAVAVSGNEDSQVSGDGPGSQPTVDQSNDDGKNKDQPSTMEMSNDNDLAVQGDQKENDNGVGIAAGSPFPGIKQLGEPIRIQKEIVDILKNQVFGFDTFFVTSQEPYEGGVLFKGNLRGTAAKSYQKIIKRMQDKFGDEYKLFLLINPEDDKPVAVVVPRKTIQPQSTVVPEWFAAGAFGLVTILTLLLRNVPALQSNLLSILDNSSLLKDGLPGAIVTLLILGVHEAAHFFVASDMGIKLGVPYFVPSWQIGSFGSITRIVSIVPSREDLLKLASAGPLAGYALGFLLLFLGFILPPSDGIGIIVDPTVFHESLLPGAIAKLLLGDALKEGAPISLNPLVLWAWAGLLINAINSIPSGELDGGRISFSIWGRKASSRLGAVTLGLLGISSLFSDVAFYWVVLIFFLQRGPIAPLSEEITEPDNKYITLGIAVLIIGLLICLPYPFAFNTDAVNIDF